VTFKLVCLESPYGSRVDGSRATKQEVEENVSYARQCVHDCFQRGEACFASHLLYTQPLILDDGDPEERRRGMQAGFAWAEKASHRVVYFDRGVTRGMVEGVIAGLKIGQLFETRSLFGKQWADAEGGAALMAAAAAVMSGLPRDIAAWLVNFRARDEQR
jgi:hypothetical protein